MKKSFFCGLAMLTAVCSASAQNQVEPVFTKLALYKNGCAFVEMSVTPVEGQKTLSIINMPVPAHGTLWYESDGNSTLSLISGKGETIKTAKPHYNLVELALANPGRDVKYTNLKGEAFTGTITLIKNDLKNKDDDETLPPFLGLKTATGFKYVKPDDIADLEFIGQEELKTPMLTIRQAALQLHFDKIDINDPIRLSCITNGITWSPSYRFEMKEDGTGTLKAQAEITNNLGNIANADLDLVSGYPIIQFANVPSAISMPDLGRDLLPAIQDSRFLGGRASGLKTSGKRTSIASEELADFESTAIPQSAAAMSPRDAQQAENLFFYPVKGFSCPKGECIAVPLFSKEMPYEHVLSWTVNQVQPRHAAEEIGIRQDVWRCIKITNTLDIALAEAPIEFISKEKFTGQNTMPLTPAGQTKTIMLNKSMDVTASAKEKILSQEKLDPKRNQTKYQIEGELSIKNITEKPVKMIISKPIQGIISECSDNGDISKLPIMPNQLNPNNFIKWEISLEPDMEKKITYKYQWISN